MAGPNGSWYQEVLGFVRFSINKLHFSPYFFTFTVQIMGRTSELSSL